MNHQKHNADSPAAVAAGVAELPPGLTDSALGEVLRGYAAVADRLQRTAAALQREVARLRRELASKDRELERRRRLAALGELAAGVAHEVRNPLGAIQLYSGLLRGQCTQSGPALELIEKIEAGIKAIESVVQDTLALAPRGCKSVHCSLRAIIAGAHDVARGKLEAYGVRLTTELDDPNARVWANADALQRVLVNLVVNAAEAAPRDSTISVRVERAPAQRIRVHVLDEGPGLPPEVLDRIFDPFFTTKAHGTGLGLTIAHRLVDAQGGRLTARNRPGGGAEFTIELPTVRAEAAGSIDEGFQQTSAA